MLSFFFEEVVDVGVSLPYQLFGQLALVDVTTMTDSIADLSFKLIRARTDAKEATMIALKSKNFTEYLPFRENGDDKEVSVLPSTSVV